MTSKTGHEGDPVDMILIARHLTMATSGETLARECGIARLTELVQAPTIEAWLALLLAAQVGPSVTRRPVPTVTDEDIPARVEGRIIHVSVVKSSKSGASIAFVLIASASDPTVIYGPIMLFRAQDIRRAAVSDVVRIFNIGQPTAEARAAREGGLRATGTMLGDDEAGALP